MRSIRRKKGQQALEYLVTYGWAFVVILVTIGAFAYFGILNPQTYLPSRCDFGVQLVCVDYVLRVDAADCEQGCVLLKLQNTFGENITITNIQTAEEEGAFWDYDEESDSYTQLSPGTDDIRIWPGEENELAVVLNLANSEYTLVEGEKQLVPVMIEFIRDDRSGAEDLAALEARNPKHYILGEIFSTTQES